MMDIGDHAAGERLPVRRFANGAFPEPAPTQAARKHGGYYGNDEGDPADGTSQEPLRSSHYGKGPRGYSRADDRLRDDVCEALTLSPDVDATEIDVRVREGEAVLSGFVVDPEQKDLAAFVAGSVAGVHCVRNELRAPR